MLTIRSGTIWTRFAKADMMIRDGDPNNMRYGDNLSENQFPSYQFQCIISNPFGIDWKREQKAVEAEAAAEPTTESTTEAATEYVEETKPGIPFTSLSLVADMEKLTFKGQYLRLMVGVEPENTTDTVVWTSGDEIGLLQEISLAAGLIF